MGGRAPLCAQCSCESAAKLAPNGYGQYSIFLQLAGWLACKQLTTRHPPIRAATPTEKPRLPVPPGTRLTALGWGDTRPGTFSPSEPLQQVRPSCCSGCTRLRVAALRRGGTLWSAGGLLHHSTRAPQRRPSLPYAQLELALRPLRACQRVFPKSPGYRKPENMLICAGGDGCGTDSWLGRTASWLGDGTICCVHTACCCACPTAGVFAQLGSWPTNAARTKALPVALHCAGNAPGYPNNICKGDSGGPLLQLGIGGTPGGSGIAPDGVADVQLGISSFTHNASVCLGEPAGFTNLAQLGPWIAETIDDLTTGLWVGRGECHCQRAFRIALPPCQAS